MKTACLLFSILFFTHQPAYPQNEFKTRTYTYKTIDTTQLKLHVVNPRKLKGKNRVPAVVFFFGGGWVQGTTAQFIPHCQYLANLGIIGITAEYRVRDKHGTTPLDAISDAKSALRWIKANAEDLRIDGDRIIAAGGSAGGHLAACTATLASFNDPQDDLSIDPMPDALILFNPVLVVTSFTDRFGGDEMAKEASPIFYVTEDTPPALIFHGTDDQLVPASTILEFQKKMIGLGNTCEVILFGDEKHAFFNKGKKDDRPYHQTLVLMKQFLLEEGFLEK